MPYTDSYEAIKVFRPSVIEINCDPDTGKNLYGSAKDRSHVGESKSIAIISITVPTRPPQTFRSIEGNDFIYLYRAMAPLQDTHQTFDTPRTEHVQAYCTIVRLGSTERSVPKSLAYCGGGISRHRFGEHCKVAATTTAAMNHQSFDISGMLRQIASADDSR
jgi:hypothetical protein